MHITLRMTIMFSVVGALKEGGDSRTVAFVGKVENPWSETKTKHVPELLVLKTEVIFFFGLCMFRQRMLADNSITSRGGQVSRNGSRMRTITSS